MLEIDESRLSAELATKFKAHPTIPNRFVYTVDASREEERKFGVGAALITDGLATSQLGERKSLPFVTKGITTAGEIVMSSQNEICQFFEKRFKINNTLIEGAIKYEVGGVATDIAASEFVSFAVERTGVRIGSMNITANGHFTLNLRAEYEFTWSEDPIQLSYIKDGVVYQATYTSLEALYNSVVVNGETLLLQVK